MSRANKWQAHAPADVIILDLGLPDLGGLEIIRQKQWGAEPVRRSRE